ncbi:4Fe-4S dicluster domain-containing protein [bacterium]|nr:4Fe-4S dicluster domain-containing protein [bacterium]
MKTLAELVKSATGTTPLDCYQCGRCSAGCTQNVTEGMDMGPVRIMRLIQMEEAFKDQPETAAEYCDRVLTSDTIWMCASCQTCTQRCPQGIDIAGTMDVMRQTAIQRGKAAKSRRVYDIVSAHKAFINCIRRTGKNDEVALVGEYKMRTGNFLSDMNMAPQMMLKGKMSPFGAIGSALSLLKSGPADNVKHVFEAAEALRKEEEEQ